MEKQITELVSLLDRVIAGGGFSYAVPSTFREIGYSICTVCGLRNGAHHRLCEAKALEAKVSAVKALLKNAH